MMDALPLVLALIWLIAANIAGAVPSRDNHWRRAYILMALGAPLTIWLALSAGWIPTLFFLACAASVLRWPLFYAAKWVKRMLSKGA